MPPGRDAILPAWLPRVNRAIVNPVQLRWAPHLPPFAVVVHRGRRSGRDHATPVLAVRHGAGYAIALPYGSRTDWVRNVRAAGGAELRRAGARHEVVHPRLAGAAERRRLPLALRVLPTRVPVLLVDLA